MSKSYLPPKVLILLAAYNGSDYIKEQLDSILRQKNIDIHILISLDLSTDNTHTIIKSYMAKHEFIKMLPYGEKLGSAGKNFFHLINKCKVDNFNFICFADQDDIWDEKKIYSAIKLMDDKNAHGYSSNVIAYWNDGRKKIIKKNSPQTKYDYLFESPGPGCTFVMTNQLFSSIKRHIDSSSKDAKLPWLHDWYCYSFARFNSYKWIIDDKPLMLYRQHSSNEVGANTGITAYLNRIKVMFEGQAIYEVLSQAEFIGQKNMLPIKYLKQGRFGAAKLVFFSFSLRRKILHKFFCFLYFMLLIFIGIKSTGNHK